MAKLKTSISSLKSSKAKALAMANFLRASHQVQKNEAARSDVAQKRASLSDKKKALKEQMAKIEGEITGLKSKAQSLKTKGKDLVAKLKDSKVHQKEAAKQQVRRLTTLWFIPHPHHTLWF